MSETQVHLAQKEECHMVLDAKPEQHVRITLGGPPCIYQVVLYGA